MNKKALLIAPALGVLLLAAAGSVGGTVAWFTSSTSVSTQVSQFKAIATDGNLTIETAAGWGTSTDSPTNSVVYVGANASDIYRRMTHASFDHTASTLFTKSAETVTGVRVVDSSAESDWKAKLAYDGTENHDVYFAVSWNLTFTFNWASEAAVNLYFDGASALVANHAYTAHAKYSVDDVVTDGGSLYICKTATADAATPRVSADWDSVSQYTTGSNYSVGDVVKYEEGYYRCKVIVSDAPTALASANWDLIREDTVKGLRIAFIPLAVGAGSNTTTGSSGNLRVWAPYRTVAEGSNQATYINASDNTTATATPDTTYGENGTAYVAPALIDSTLGKDKEALRPSNAVIAADAAVTADKLGSFATNGGAASKIEFKCVAWFEGTDSSVVDASIMDPIVASLKFYSREARI